MMPGVPNVHSIISNNADILYLCKKYYIWRSTCGVDCSSPYDNMLSLSEAGDLNNDSIGQMQRQFCCLTFSYVGMILPESLEFSATSLFPGVSCSEA